MITAVFEGCNNATGYHLHKRAAISLNALAAVLDENNDEILFIDHGTPDDFITLPEALSDTLTPTCKAMLRILRIRPKPLLRIQASHTDPVLVALAQAQKQDSWMMRLALGQWVQLCPPHKTWGDALAQLKPDMFAVPLQAVAFKDWQRWDRKAPLQYFGAAPITPYGFVVLHCETPAETANPQADLRYMQPASQELTHHPPHSGLRRDEVFEIIRLDAAREHNLLEAMNGLFNERLQAPYRQPHMGAELIACPPEHLKPYIAEMLYTFHRDTVVGYLGEDDKTYQTFLAVWRALGFRGACHPVLREKMTLQQADDVCGLFVVDYPVTDSAAISESHGTQKRMLAIAAQWMAMEREKRLQKTHVPRKFIVLNGIQGAVVATLRHFLAMQEGPFGTRIRHGIVGLNKQASIRKDNA